MTLTSLRSNQTLANAAVASESAASIVRAGPPGADFPGRVFELDGYARHGFPFWRNGRYAGRYTFGACIGKTPGGMTALRARRAGTARLELDVSASGAFAALTGSTTSCSAG